MTETHETSHTAPVIEVVPPPLAEMRGLRLLLPHTPTPRRIRRLVKAAADTGFNLLAVRVYRRGTTLWPSEIASHWKLPTVRRWLGGRDIMAELSQACVEHGVALAAWVDLLPAVDHTRERWSPLARRHWAWRMRRFTGSPYPQGPESEQIFLCPAWPEVRRFLAEICCEVVERYSVEALWLEGTRYPLGAQHPDTSMCHCPVCRERLRAETGIDLEEISLDASSVDYQEWTRWREQQIEHLLTEIITRVRKMRVGLPVFGGVPLGYDPESTSRVGLMDWARWVREGLLDLAIPMPFGSPGAMSDEEWASALHDDFYHVSPSGHLAPLLLPRDIREGQCPRLEAARRLPLSGHVWDATGGQAKRAEWSTVKRLHGTRRALVPELDPRDCMGAVINETVDLTASTTALGSFLDDLLAFLQSGFGQLSDAQMGDHLEGLSQFHDLVEDGEIVVSDRDRAVRNLDWLQRQLVHLRARQLLTRGH